MATLNIQYKNGFTDKLSSKSYDDWNYDGKAFIIYKNGDAILLTNFDVIASVYFTDEEVEQVEL